MVEDLKSYVLELGKAARAASRSIAVADTETKSRTLQAIAAETDAARDEIKAANSTDMAQAEEKGIDQPLIDRLLLDDKGIDRMIEGILQVDALRDPVGEVTDLSYMPTGIQVGKMRVPLGVIAMCLTGNFAISLMADDNVLAGVASQPSMPLNRQHALHMSEEEIAQARSRLDEHGPMMALRFEGDPLCTATKFKAIGDTFNDDKQRIRLVELPGKGHSVLTLDLIKGGEPAQQALNDVLSYFADKLNLVVP